jgi:hypothetical protein
MEFIGLLLIAAAIIFAGLAIKRSIVLSMASAHLNTMIHIAFEARKAGWTDAQEKEFQEWVNQQTGHLKTIWQ